MQTVRRKARPSRRRGSKTQGAGLLRRARRSGARRSNARSRLLGAMGVDDGILSIQMGPLDYYNHDVRDVLSKLAMA